MQFDQTSIAIRERSTLEVFDLAANVLVRHLQPIMVLLFLNAMPFVILDYYLINWMTDVSFSVELSTAYYAAMLALIVSQAQLGTCLITIFMGRVMFLDEYSVGAVLRQFLKRLPYFLYSQGILRLAFFAVLLAMFTSPKDTEAAHIVAWLGLPAIATLGLLIRAIRPFVPEVIYLEQTALKSKNDLPSLGLRSSNLHTLAAGSITMQFLSMALFAPLLLLAVHSVFVMADSMFSIRANSEISLQPFYILAAGWLVAGFLAVVRFLLYIDVRIRQEGWAVDLKFRSENTLLRQSRES